MVAVPEQSTGPFASPTTWTQWMQFIDAPSVRMEGEGPWSVDERLDYHSRFVVLSTPVMDKVSLTVRRLLILNRRHNGTARRGLILSGPPTTGKTTALQQIGRSFHLAEHRRHSGSHGTRLPVVFLSVPPAATAKMLVSEFARFLGLPITPRMNQAQITDAVCHLLGDLATRLVLVDDVHLLDTRTRAGAETSDQMKHLSERLAATFVYAGVDVEASPLLTGARGTQLAGRFKMVRNPPLAYAGTESRQAWHGLVGGMEAALRLERHPAGTLVRHAGYLHQRTGGRIGSLSALVREAAVAAICDGSERITKKLLAGIEADQLAEQAARPPDRRTTGGRI